MGNPRQVVSARTRRGRHLVIAAGVIALASACVPPTTETPEPPPTNALTIVVGGTLASPAAGGKVVLRDDQAVNSPQIPLTDLPASALGTSAIDSLLESAPLRTASPESAPLRTATIASLPLRTADAPQVLLSTVSLVDGRTWAQVLAGTPLAGTPTQNITLNQVATLAAAGGAPAAAALTLADLDLQSSPLRTASIASLALGNTTLGQLPAESPAEADPFTRSWCPWITGSGLKCADFSAQSTVLSLDLRGAPLRTAPLRTAPLRTADLSSSPLRTAPLRTAFLDASPLRTAPLRTAVLGASSLSSISLSALPLRTADLNSSPLRTAPLRTASAALVSQLVDCGRVDCTAASTATLGDAADLSPSALKPAATVGLYFLAFPEDVTSAFTLGDLKEYGSATIGDIQSSLPDTITVADAIVALVPTKALSWESIPFDDLKLPLHGGTPAVAVTAQFTLAADRDTGSTQLTVALPPQAIYVPRNAVLAKQGGGFSVAAGGIEPTISGGTLTFVIPAGAPAGRYNLGFPATATQALSAPLQFTATALSTGAPETASATIPVVAADPSHASATPTLGDGDLYLGVLSSTSGAMTFNVGVPSVVGSVTQVSLSHLPADFDLVGYKPSTVAPVSARTFRSNGLKSPPIGSTDPELGGFVAAPDVQALRDLSLAKDPATVASYSSNRGTADEKIQLVTRPGDSGTYTFQVSGYNGAVSDDVFLVSVRQNVPAGSGACGTRSTVAAAAASTGTIAAGTKTAFLVDTQRMIDVYGAPAYASMRAKLDAVAARPEVAGSVISIDGDPAVRTAYSALNAQPCNAAAANGVVQAIDGLVDRLLQPVPGANPWKDLTSVVVVGSDQQIPMARIADGTASSNEADYASETQQYDTAGNPTAPSPLSAAASARMMLTDDAYGSWNPIAWRDSALFLPDVALGRLVEKPSEIGAALDNYANSFPSGSQGRLDSSTALVSGYDFMADGATTIDTALSAHIPSRQSLISNSWDKTALLSDLYPAGQSPAVDSLNAHFDHHSLLPAAGNTTGDLSSLVTTADVATNPNRLQGRLVFSMGCHSGLSVPDGYLTGTSTTADAPADTDVVPGETAAQTAARRARLDWAEAFANDGAVYIGNTGYGYGDSSAVSFSERLMVELAKRLDGSVSAGQALQFAKQGYYGSLATFSDYDQKSLMETVFYGLPFWGIGAASTPPTVPGTVTPAPDPATGGVQSAAASVTPAFSFTPTANGTVVTADGKPPTVVDQQPIIPRTSIDVTPTSASLEVHGYVITSLASTDDPNVQTAFGRATVDQASSEQPISPPGVAFPATLQNTNIQTDASGRRQYVNLNVAQFIGALGSPGVGTLRRFTSVGGQALYSPTNTDDGIVPTVATAVATPGPSTIQFDVTASDTAPGASPGTTVPGQTKRVAVMYHDATGWHLLNLSSIGTSGGLDQWRGTAPASAGSIDWFAQVVDAVGNVSTTSNKATLYSAPPAGDAAPSITIDSSPSLVVGPFLVSGTVADPDGPAPLTGQIDLGQGAGFQALDIVAVSGGFEWSLSGSSYLTGNHTVTVRICDGAGVCGQRHAHVATGQLAVQVAPARNETCVLMADGSVNCWGWNLYGELGDGTGIDSLTPVNILPAGSATSIASGWDHTCAIMVNTTLECWGYNADGQIGDGTTTDRFSPTVVPGLTGVVQVSAASYHTCALLADGTVRCWGEGDYGEAGDGAGVNRSSPVVVTGLSNIRSISAGKNHACANSNTGGLFCWGNNALGQLGDGTFNSAFTPVQIAGLYAKVSAGGDHTCEIAAGGTVRCQGANFYGQLGSVTGLNISENPVDAGIASQNELATGEDFSCSLQNIGGGVSCWGNNDHGQLGRGTSGAPESNPGGILGGASQFAIDFQTVCVVGAGLVEPGGLVYCWGNNNHGQAGDGTTTDVLAPRRVNVLATTSTTGQPYCLGTVVSTEAELRSAALAGGAYCVDPVTISLTTGELVVTTNLTLTSSGPANATIDAGGNSRVVYNTGSLTLRDITISGGDSAGSSSTIAGGIHNDGGTVTLNGATRVSNNISYDSAGIQNEGTLTLNDNATVTNNTSANEAGGIRNTGNTTLNGHATVTFNTAGGGNGGGGILNLFSNLTINDSAAIIGNTSGSFGGGILNYGGVITMNGPTAISGNHADHGGGIHAFSGTVTLNSQAMITNNIANVGGGIANQAATITQNGAVFAGNVPDDCNNC